MQKLAGQRYIVERRASLIIVRPRSRSRLFRIKIPDIQLGRQSLSSFAPYLIESLKDAAHCAPKGYIFGGPPVDVGLPRLYLHNASLEQVLAAASSSREPVMWIIAAGKHENICSDFAWQIGTYADLSSPNLFKAWVGSQLAH